MKRLTSYPRIAERACFEHKLTLSLVNLSQMSFNIFGQEPYVEQANEWRANERSNQYPLNGRVNPR